MDEFTKGEWKTCWFDNGIEGKLLFIKIKGGQGICEMIPTKQQKANAHLITAAGNVCQKVKVDNPIAALKALPDLYAACKELVDIVDNSPGDIDSFTTQPAKAALAKAEKEK